jgi:outer membrane protein assembly factor BamB
MLQLKLRSLEGRLASTKREESLNKKRRVLLVSWLFFILASLCFVSAVQLSASIDSPSITWEHDFGENITGITVTDGKVFVLLVHGDFFCMDQQTGNVSWSYSLGGYLLPYGDKPLIYVDAGRLFVISGSQGKRLSCFEMDSGKPLWDYDSTQSPLKSSFTIANGKVLIDGKILNGTDGQVLWGVSDHPDFAGELTFVNNHVLAGSGSIVNDTLRLNSINPDNGNVLWSARISTPLDAQPVVADGRVIIWNPNIYQVMLCLNETDGSLLWSSDAGAQSLLRTRPLVTDGLVLFGASDNYLYALDEEDGLVSWRFYQENLTEQFFGPVTSDQRAFFVSQGCAFALSKADGTSAWATDNLSISTICASPASLLYATAGRSSYAQSAANLYALNVNNGAVNWTQNYVYWVLRPVPAYNKVFVPADLKVIAYDDAGVPEFEEPENPEQPNTSLILLLAVIAVVVIVIMLFYRMKRRRNYSLKGGFE